MSNIHVVCPHCGRQAPKITHYRTGARSSTQQLELRYGDLDMELAKAFNGVATKPIESWYHCVRCGQRYKLIFKVGDLLFQTGCDHVDGWGSR